MGLQGTVMDFLPVLYQLTETDIETELREKKL